MAYTVGQVAQVASVTVRTLHHYDDIGLLSPSGRTAAGYRRYDDADLERLQLIRYYRELGFPLEEIATIIDGPGVDPVAHLRRQHELLTARIKRLQEMVAAIEFAMEAGKLGISLTPEERFEVFGDVDPDEYAEEAEQRWGGSEAYRESMRRTSGYGKEDWLRIKRENEDWGRRFGAVMASGVPADSREAMDLAEEHRQLISQQFYECSYEIHTGLADMYTGDPRFTAYYETIRPGMAEYLSEAIHANAITRACGPAVQGLRAPRPGKPSTDWARHRSCEPHRGGVAMKVHSPSSNAVTKDYDVSDIERLMGKRDWKSYDEVIKWLAREGDADRRFTPGEVRHMIDDFSRMRDAGMEFVQDPEMLFQQAKGTR